MIRQFFKYTVAGGIAASAHFLVLILLVENSLTSPTVASGIGFCVACLINYTLQYHWTFEASGSHRLMISRYTLVTLTMLLVNLVMFWLFATKVGIHYVLSQVLATGLVVLLNFTVNRRWTFA